MTNYQTLQRYGLFDKRVPRYTSYPPANQFQVGVGSEHHSQWLQSVPDDEVVSLYVHIPFCRRLCWFCACRTQGTQSAGPVDDYIETLKVEIDLVRKNLPSDITLGRLHLGGGTPTILTARQMASLLETIFSKFSRSNEFEFSVEIDPTDAEPSLVESLVENGLNRASIGIQDFSPRVQAAIGRLQSIDQTHWVVERLRKANVPSLNFDLLYGLPYQTEESLKATLEQAVELQPDRVALYGYAHVPWMSKRQVMIDESALPSSEDRFQLEEFSRAYLLGERYLPVGTDHFAKPADSLAKAANARRMRRNFQGFTDDQAATLIGLGASAISHFRQGYLQNAVSTAAYLGRLREGQLVANKGFVLGERDLIVGAMIEELMCYGSIDKISLSERFPAANTTIDGFANKLVTAFPDVLVKSETGLRIPKEFAPLTRIIAGHLDQFSRVETAHSLAV